MNSQMTREAKSAVAELAGADGLRVLIIEGAGGVFSAGADVVEMGALTEDTARDFISNLHSLIHVVREFPHPVVCKCQGYVLGGALELMLGCDLRVAADDTKFGMPEVRVGVPSVIEAALFTPFCGLGAAQDLLLTGRTFDAHEAHRLGIVQRICPQAELDETTHGAVVAELLEAAPGALSAQKALLRRVDGGLSRSRRSALHRRLRGLVPNRRTTGRHGGGARKASSGMGARRGIRPQGAAPPFAVAFAGSVWHLHSSRWNRDWRMEMTEDEVS